MDEFLKFTLPLGSTCTSGSLGGNVIDVVTTNVKFSEMAGKPEFLL